jgi:alpha-L-fucosidase
MNATETKTDWFKKARYGMFIHYGLYSMLGRGEWVMNRERLSLDDMRDLARRFKPDRFNADELCDLAVESGMRYVNLTTMHHDGFRLYDTELSDFNAKRYTGRDLVEEFVTAARKRGLRVVLYHTLNNWFDQPDAVAALENEDARREFLDKTIARFRELVTRFNPIDVLWYDGWWPFIGEGWRASELDAMVRSIQPNILLNGRHGGTSDFATPEQHMTAPTPWRPWEACMTLNNHWGYHRGDHAWKSPGDVVSLLAKAADGKGNLLLNIGPRGDGSVPEESVRIVKAVGHWLSRCGECIFDTDLCTWGLEKREGHNSEWSNNGPFTLKGRSLYQLVRYWPGPELTIAGLSTKVESVWLLSKAGKQACRFTQTDGKIVVTGLPEETPDPVCPVLRLDCRDVPSMYLTGGMRIPTVPHPPYDPCASDIAGGLTP